MGVNRVLCDIREIEGLDHGAPSMWSRFETNEFVALSLPKKMRLSVWAKPQQISPDGFEENVMVNRGAAVRVTSDLEDALLWLGVEEEKSQEAGRQKQL